MKTTVNEMAERLGVPYQTAYGLFAYLKAKGLVKDLGSRKPAGGTGRGPTEYEVPARVELVFFEEKSEEKPVDEPASEEAAA